MINKNEISIIDFPSHLVSATGENIHEIKQQIYELKDLKEYINNNKNIHTYLLMSESKINNIYKLLNHFNKQELAKITFTFCGNNKVLYPQQDKLTQLKINVQFVDYENLFNVITKNNYSFKTISCIIQKPEYIKLLSSLNSVPKSKAVLIVNDEINNDIISIINEIIELERYQELKSFYKQHNDIEKTSKQCELIYIDKEKHKQELMKLYQKGKINKDYLIKRLYITRNLFLYYEYYGNYNKELKNIINYSQEIEKVTTVATNYKMAYKILK